MCAKSRDGVEMMQSTHVKDDDLVIINDAEEYVLEEEEEEGKRSSVPFLDSCWTNGARFVLWCGIQDSKFGFPLPYNKIYQSSTLN